MNWKYYHNSKCSKSRQGLEFLKNKDLEVEVVEYMKTSLESSELIELLKLLKDDENYFIRKKEEAYKALSSTELSIEQWANEIVKSPKLLERPILSNGVKAVIGRPTENLEKIL
ncbi:hypothetical protein OAT67_01135 [Bacteriovoracaceae bacterium]|nr:hypothetical protein [Bacteriovoracaceae bacterium]